MKKTVIVEYVGIEDIQDIMDDAYALMRDGHYVNVEMHNINTDKISIEVMIKLDGWDANKLYDYDFRFYMSDEEFDVNTMNECKNTMKNLLAEVGL